MSKVYKSSLAAFGGWDKKCIVMRSTVPKIEVVFYRTRVYLSYANTTWGGP